MKKLLAIMMVCIAAAWGCWWFLAVIRLPEWSARAALGEMFGGINALFSGLALAGIIVTVYVQTKELELQRRQLHDTATAQQETGAVLVEQLNALRRQVAASQDSANALNQTATLQCLASLTHAYSAVLIERSQETPVRDIQNRLNRCIAHIERLARQAGLDLGPTEGEEA
jgi:predicted lipid-binding transport protein (Tim44 family)